MRSRLRWINAKGSQEVEVKDLTNIQLMEELLFYLRRKEESDSGRVFYPNSISSVRVMDGSILGQVLAEMEKRVGVSE